MAIFDASYDILTPPFSGLFRPAPGLFFSEKDLLFAFSSLGQGTTVALETLNFK